MVTTSLTSLVVTTETISDILFIALHRKSDILSWQIVVLPDKYLIVWLTDLYQDHRIYKSGAKVLSVTNENAGETFHRIYF